MTQLSLTRSINLQREAAVGAKTGGDIKQNGIEYTVGNQT